MATTLLSFEKLSETENITLRNSGAIVDCILIAEGLLRVPVSLFVVHTLTLNEGACALPSSWVFANGSYIHLGQTGLVRLRSEPRLSRYDS